MHCQLSVQIFLPKVGQSLLEKDSPVSILSSLCWLESPFLGDRWERWNLPPVHFKPTSGLFSVSSYFQALSSNSRLRCSPCKRIWISSATPPPHPPKKVQGFHLEVCLEKSLQLWPSSDLKCSHFTLPSLVSCETMQLNPTIIFFQLSYHIYGYWLLILVLSIGSSWTPSTFMQVSSFG